MTRGGKQRGTHPKMRNLETHATSTQAQRTKTRRGLCSLECHQSQMYSCCMERAGLRTPSHLRRPHKEILCVIHLAIEHSRLRQFSLTQLRRSPHSFTYTQSRVELVWHLLMHDLTIHHSGAPATMYRFHHSRTQLRGGRCNRAWRDGLQLSGNCSLCVC